MPANLKTLDLGSLGDLNDGGIGQLFGLKLRTLMDDMTLRPSNSKPRKLIINVEFTPRTRKDTPNILEDVVVHIKMDEKLPIKSGDPIVMLPRATSGGRVLQFNPGSETIPEQTAFGFEQE